MLDAPESEGGASDADFPDAVRQQLNVDGALWYLAGMNLFTNYDSYYAGHNYYLYQAEEDARFHVLAWDVNEAFGLFPGAGISPSDSTAVAQTDHGNLFGVPEFYHYAREANVQPIVGCEFYVTPSGMQDTSDRTRYHQVLLAKNEEGYRNLIKLSSLSYTDGFYYNGWVTFEFSTFYAYPAYISSTWAADNGIDGCPDNVTDLRCMAILLSDQDEFQNASIPSAVTQMTRVNGRSAATWRSRPTTARPATTAT